MVRPMLCGLLMASAVNSLATRAAAQESLTIPSFTPVPVAVAGVAAPVLSLDGEWRFCPARPPDVATLTEESTADWARITVPGEWAMQGFKVGAGTPAVYFRTFQVPADWSGRRMRLRFDGVHSVCRAYVNGHAVGDHEGVATAFELDLTGVAYPGANRLALLVTSESDADVIASASQYAAHQLGGIVRKVTLYATPALAISGQVVETSFDRAGQDATVEIELVITGRAAGEGQATVCAVLTDPAGRAAGRASANVSARADDATAARVRLRIPLPAALKWDPEHPRLYMLETSLCVADQEVERVRQRVGVREVQVRGQQLLVNGTPVKLRGVNRHEVHPLAGRSTPRELARRDAELFRAANVNYIRTSHYPPTEEFLDACDELGLFVECEAAVCWVGHGANATWKQREHAAEALLPVLMRANLESVAFNRHHPSVIIWSLGNESAWTPLFERVLQAVKARDPTRPVSFHDQCWGDYNNLGSRADIANYHYPGTNGPAAAAREPRPVLFGEFAHINTYNRGELAADPGVRDDWGARFDEMVRLMDGSAGCLGGAVWAGIDEVFVLPEGRRIGYGHWGIIDGWRRPKPEYWHLRKAYAPVRVLTRDLTPAADGSLSVEIENGYNFADLSEVGVYWSSGQGPEQRARIEAPPHSRATLRIHPGRSVARGDTLALRFVDPRGFTCQEELLAIGAGTSRPTPPAAGRPGIAWTPAETPGAWTISRGSLRAAVEKVSGTLTLAAAERPLIVGGPGLMVLPLHSDACEPTALDVPAPLNAPCDGWTVSTVAAEAAAPGRVVVRVSGEFRQARGAFVIGFEDDGGIEIAYEFVSKLKVNPRQVGLLLFVPRELERLTWERRGCWTVYPADHIGRLRGSATPFPTGPDGNRDWRRPPGWTWNLDTAPLGSNDFRSTKARVIKASLTDAAGAGLELDSDGSLSSRVFMDDGRIGWLFAHVNTGGGDMFYSPHHSPDRRPIDIGTPISGRVRLHVLPTRDASTPSGD